jgi:hypothetical protein
VVLTDERLQSQDRSARASARRVRAGATAAAMPARDQIAVVVDDACHTELRWRDRSYVLTEVPE